MEEIDYENTENENDQDDSSPEDSGEYDNQPDDSTEPEELEESSESEQESHEEYNEKQQKPDIRERLAQIQRERYKALQEADNLRLENEMLRKSAQMASNQAVKQYDENLARRYENARVAKARAMEEGDIQAQIDADSELAMVTSELYQASLIRAQNNIQSSQQSNQYAYQPPDNSHYAAQWVQENSWFHPDSPDFDPWLAEQLDNEMHDYDYRLRMSGNEGYIMSPGYLNEVNQRAQILSNYRNQNGQKRELNMKQSRMPISPVRNGYSQNTSKKQDVRLNSAEKDLARRLGIKESAYLQQKIRDERENAHKRIGGR